MEFIFSKISVFRLEFAVEIYFVSKVFVGRSRNFQNLYSVKHPSATATVYIKYLN